MSVAGTAIREIITRLEAVDIEREKILAEAEGAGFEVDMIEVIVKTRACDRFSADANLNLSEMYLDALKPAPAAVKTLRMTEKAKGSEAEDYYAMGWTDKTLVEHGYAEYA